MTVKEKEGSPKPSFSVPFHFVSLRQRPNTLSICCCFVDLEIALFLTKELQGGITLGCVRDNMFPCHVRRGLEVL